MTEVNKKKANLVTIDALRGIAALWVVAVHSRATPAPFSLSNPLESLLALPVQLGYLGVTLFLVISGFCIHLNYAKRLANVGSLVFNWKDFWFRRFYRLYPSYLVAIAFSLLILIILPNAWRRAYEEEVFCWDLGAHLLLIHNLFISYNDGLGNGVFWTLGLEAQLYALYCLYCILRVRFSCLSVLLISLSVTILWKIFFHLYLDTPQQWSYAKPLGPPHFEVGIWLQWPFAYWFSWVLGAVGAEAYANSTALSSIWFKRRAACLCFLLGLMTCEYIVLGRYIPSAHGALSQATGITNWRPLFCCVSALSEPLMACGFLVCLNRMVRLEVQKGIESYWLLLLASVGVFSYSLYLIHIPVISVTEFLIPFDTLPLSSRSLLRLAIHPTISLLVGYWFFRLVESHFLKTRALSGQSTGRTV